MPELDGMSQACLYDTHIGVELRTCKEPGCTCVCHPVTDGQAVPPPAGAITAREAIARCLADFEGSPDPEHYSLADDVLLALRNAGMSPVAAPAIAAQALADAHLVPDTLIDETRRDEREACARLAEQEATARCDQKDCVDCIATEAAMQEVADLIRARTTP